METNLLKTLCSRGVTSACLWSCSGWAGNRRLMRSLVHRVGFDCSLNVYPGGGNYDVYRVQMWQADDCMAEAQALGPATGLPDWSGVTRQPGTGPRVWAQPM